MSKDFEKTANLDFDEMQVVVDIFDSMPEGPWDTDTGDSSADSWETEEGTTALPAYGPVRNKDTYLHMLDLAARVTLRALRPS